MYKNAWKIAVVAPWPRPFFLIFLEKDINIYMVSNFTYIIIFFICKIYGMRNAIGTNVLDGIFFLPDFIVDADRTSDKKHGKADSIEFFHCHIQNGLIGKKLASLGCSLL